MNNSNLQKFREPKSRGLNIFEENYFLAISTDLIHYNDLEIINKENLEIVLIHNNLKWHIGLYSWNSPNKKVALKMSISFFWKLLCTQTYPCQSSHFDKLAFVRWVGCINLRAQRFFGGAESFLLQVKIRPSLSFG